MSHFTAKELEFLATQRLGRLATVNPKGHPQIAPVGFHYNPDLDVIEIGGQNFSQSKKFRNIQQNPHVSFVVDDVLPPWRPRGVEVRGVAEAIPDGGRVFIRIKPSQIIGWGLEGEGYKPLNRKVESTANSI